MGVVPNSEATILGPGGGNSITDDFCSKQKSKFGDLNDFAAKGALREMGAALERGMVLVLSLWDDTDVSMGWLDAAYPSNEPARKPGVLRGPCPSDATSEPKYLRATVPEAHAAFSQIKVGEIGSTYGEDSSRASSRNGCQLCEHQCTRDATVATARNSVPWVMLRHTSLYRISFGVRSCSTSVLSHNSVESRREFLPEPPHDRASPALALHLVGLAVRSPSSGGFCWLHACMIDAPLHLDGA